MSQSDCPSLYQIDTRLWLSKLSEKISGPVTLDDVPNSELDKFHRSGFQWIWLTNIWQRGLELREVDEAARFAVSCYRVDDQLGGDPALHRLKKRLQDRGLKLVLDFEANHSAIDHEWIKNFPDYYVQGNEAFLTNEPGNYIKINNGSGELILAHGRNPFFPGWTATAQFNYGNPLLQEAMMNELVKVSGQCDGIHCDIPVLVLPGVFEQTWGIQCKPFWPKAIGRVKENNPGFRFMCEAYWDQEGLVLQQQGFDYTYITGDDMIVGGGLSRTSEITFIERSVIVDNANLKDLKTILINYLIPRADAC